MFDNVTGAQIAAKRLTRLHSIKAGLARETVARAGGFRDWHHLTTAIGQSDRPKGPDRDRLSAFVDEKGIGVPVDTMLQAIAPITQDHWPLLERIDIAEELKPHANGHFAHALMNQEASYADVTVLGKVSVTSIGYDRWLGEVDLDGIDEDCIGLGPNDEFGVPEDMSLDHDLFVIEAVAREAGEVAGVAIATWYGPGMAEVIHVANLSRALFGCDIGDENVIHALSRDVEEVEGGLLVIEVLAVPVQHRRKGVSTKLVDAVLQTAAGRGHTGMVALDHVNVTGGLPIEKAARAVRDLFSTKGIREALRRHCPNASIRTIDRGDGDIPGSATPNDYERFNAMLDEATALAESDRPLW